MSHPSGPSRIRARRGRRVAIAVAFVDVAALAGSANSIEVAFQRWHIERLRSADPDVQRSAGRWLALLLPWLTPANVRMLVKALEAREALHHDILRAS